METVQVRMQLELTLIDHPLNTQLLYRNNRRHDGFATGEEISLDAPLQYLGRR